MQDFFFFLNIKCFLQLHCICCVGLTRLGSLSIYLQKFLLLIHLLVIDVSRGTISSHSKEMQTAAYRVKPHMCDEWIVYSVLIAALLLLVLRVPVLYGIQH